MSESDTQKLQHQIVELQVSGHTMALDPGLYCVFSAPNSVAPSAETGLPTVRISAGPGPVPGRVEVVGLHESGWVGPDSATLVRVADARSTVLVTVYQAKDTRAEAPQIQVVRISAEPGSSPAAAPAPAAAGAAPSARAPAPSKPREVHIVAHIYGRGDVGGELGEWIGEAGSKRWIEGFAVAPAGEVPSADLEYQAVLGRGWLSPWSEGGQFCGSRSMALPILGLRVRLRGPSAATHRVALSATFIDGTTIGPVGDGEPCEAPSLAALESFHIEFAAAATPRVEPPTKPARASGKPAAGRTVSTPVPVLPKRGAKPAAAGQVKTPKQAEPAPAASKAAAPTRPARLPAPTRPARLPAPTRRR